NFPAEIFCIWPRGWPVLSSIEEFFGAGRKCRELGGKLASRWPSAFPSGKMSHKMAWPPRGSLRAIMLRHFSSLQLAGLFLTYAPRVPAQMNVSNGSSILSLGVAGVATPHTNTLSVAAPLANLTIRAVAEIKIDRIQLATAPVQTPLPIMV